MEWAGKERTYTTGRNNEAPFAQPEHIGSWMEAQLRGAGIPESDREAVRLEASRLLAQRVSKGEKIPVQKLPNMTKEQVNKTRNNISKPQQQAKEQERTTKSRGRSSRER